MGTQNSLKKNYLFSILMRDNEGFSRGVFSFLLLISLLPYLGAAFDEGFILDGDALGIFEHYGNMCFTIVCPLIFFFAMRGVRHFDQFISNIDKYIIEDKFKKKVKLKKFLQTNWHENPFLPLKFLFIAGGLAFATANAINALRPEEIWGHDVYDSINYFWGYVAQRIFFYIWWGYILPVFIYHLFVVVITLSKLFHLVIKTNSLILQPMCPDRAGGLGQLGRMALNFNITILLTMPIPIALYYTHGYNTPLTCGVIVQFLLLPIVFFLPLLQVHRAMRIKKESLLSNIYRNYRYICDVLMQKVVKYDKKSAYNYSIVKEAYEEESKLRAFYKSLGNIPTWPFDMRTIMQFTSTILLPALIWIAKGIKTLL